MRRAGESRQPIERQSNRVLIVVTTRSYRAQAFLDAARALGVPVVIGTERAQALAPLNPTGNLTLPAGDPDAGLAAIAAFAKEHPLGAVVAADDDASPLAARARELLGLPGHGASAVETSLNKHHTRAAFRRAGLPTPSFELVAGDADVLAAAGRAPYPCVLKPLHSSASRGVIRANDRRELLAAHRRIQTMLQGPAAVLVEGYVPGREYALEGLMTHGVPRTLALFEKPDPLEGPYFEETIYITPPRVSTGGKKEIEAVVHSATRALGLSHGPVHAEVRVNEEGVWPLEIAPRSIGGLCSRTLRFTGGASLETVLLGHALGRPEGDLPAEPDAAGVMMLPIPHGGILRGIDGLEEARRVPGVEDVRITIPLGDELVPLPEGDRYLGFIFARAASSAAVEVALRTAHDALSFDIRVDATRTRPANAEVHE